MTLYSLFTTFHIKEHMAEVEAFDELIEIVVSSNRPN